VGSTDLGDFRAALKTGKRQLSRGNASKAEHYLLRALETASYLKDERLRDEKRAFVLHRLAEVAILLNDPMTAHKRYQKALRLSNDHNEMGHARLLRDYGNFERLQGDRKSGLRHIRKALVILESIEDRSERVAIEILITEGFLARFDLDDPQRRDEAIETLRLIARKLHGYKKKAYEVANLRCLIDVLPIHSLERITYIQRATELSIRLGNYRKAGEYTALLGGQPLRSIYNFIVQ
jgi:tetratricopeptide (TPR) repeat protein